MAKSNSERVETYRAKQRAAGVIEMNVRVPFSMRECVLDLATKLRAGAPWPQDQPPVQILRVEVPGPVKIKHVEVPGPVRVERVEVPGPGEVNWVIVGVVALQSLVIGLSAGMLSQKYFHLMN
ncbi:conserved protein of unknown function [Magnetospirillum sp. XM-1]|uniref:hypothetical protein n=1 Tax=Magnetospirillum sp. XM-1 TaxID=1663591 RepID=UPI00073E0A4D|nr:hypothetical protein [Magnetospirillum sp. XM-1]CUW39507.1 conserved protein of unknown function [Magnetospirillum sp. XM-1]